MSRHTRIRAIDQELAIVNAHVEILQKREDKFQRILENIQRLRDSVHEEKAALERKGRDLELERHPINRLPVELLIQVFIIFVEDEDENLSQIEDFYHRPPVILSHVCHKWREATLSTSRLWSRIVCKFSKQDSVAPIQTFLQRACNSPLDIVYSTPTVEDLNVWHERRRVSHLLSSLTLQVSQSRSILFWCLCAESMKHIVNVLKIYDFPCLESLDLSIVSPRPSFAYTPSLNNDEMIIERLEVNPTVITTERSALKHLRLEQVPLFNIPIPFLSNLTSLELCFPQGPRPSSRFQYNLSVSAFCLFLSLVPQLTTLVLCDTVPFFDVVFDSDANGQHPTRHRKPVELSRLKRFDWTFPFPTDVHRFLIFLSVPSLEKFDICLDKTPSKRIDTRRLRGYDDTVTELNGTGNRILHFNSLKELSIHCADEDAIGSALRKLSFPVLEKVEISNVDPQGHVRKPARTSLPTLLRLESIFHDPRLPHLTQITLSHFEISPDHGRAMLGYMPALVSLSLDTCTGVGTLINVLKEPLTTTKRGVKFCPRLEGISLRGCTDAGFAAVRDLVERRNIVFPEGCDGVEESGQAAQVEVMVPTRKIKPLRRVRRQKADNIDLAASISYPLGIEENPRHINYMRIIDCPLIQEREALSLKDLGVEEVLWG